MRGEEDKCTASDGAGEYSREIPAGLDSGGGGGKAVVTAGGCEAKPCPAFSPVPAFHPVAKFERLWCVFVRKGSEVGVVLFFFFQGFWGGLYNLDAMPAACGRSRRAGWDPAGSGY